MNAHRPLIVGLLGGIASGKSTVANLLVEQGAELLDADALSRELLQTSDVAALLVQHFGPGVQASGRIQREELARRVFQNPAELRWLEELIHPRVQARIHERLRELRELRAYGALPAVVLDIPLLLEAGPFLTLCDFVIFVECAAPVRRKRAQELRGWSAEELGRREAFQRPLEEKRALADLVVQNDGSLEDLRRQLLDWLHSAGGFEALPRRAGAPPSVGPAGS